MTRRTAVSYTHLKNFGEFYDDQISHASCILLSRTQTASEEKIAAAAMDKVGQRYADQLANMKDNPYRCV